MSSGRQSHGKDEELSEEEEDTGEEWEMHFLNSRCTGFLFGR